MKSPIRVSEISPEALKEFLEWEIAVQSDALRRMRKAVKAIGTVPVEELVTNIEASGMTNLKFPECMAGLNPFNLKPWGTKSAQPEAARVMQMFKERS